MSSGSVDLGGLGGGGGGGGGGTVTSVSLLAPASVFTVTGSPITTSGVLQLSFNSQAQNTFWAGPSGGGPGLPSFRTITAADISGVTGTVTSVALTESSIYNVTGSPITTTGTLALNLKTQTAATIFAGPAVGGALAPTFRALVATDLPALSYVSSVDMTVPSFLSVSGNPITSSGTLAVTLANQTGNSVFASPSGGGVGAPTFRSLVVADLPAGTGTVTSVALTEGQIFSVSGSPVTTSGALAMSLLTQAANTIFSGPAAGGAVAPTFRTLVAADIPSLPYLSTSLPSAQIIVGNAGSIATPVAMSGDATISNTGSLTISANAVTNAKLDQMPTNTIKGNNLGGTANASDLTTSQATAMLDVMVGDSGAGGVKGLAPAPPAGSFAANRYLKADGSWSSAVSSVALTVPGFLSVSGSPVTTTGTLAINMVNQAAGTVFAGPISGPAGAPSFRPLEVSDNLGLSTGVYGTGADGDFSAAAGTTTLTNDMFWNNVTLTGTAKIVTAGYRIFIRGVLDLVNAGVDAIASNGGSGTSGAGTTAGAVGTQTTAGTLPVSGSGSSGQASPAVNVAGVTAAAPTTQTPSNGANAGSGGAGGSGQAGAGGAARTGGVTTLATNFFRFTVETQRNAASVLAGGGGAGGGSGASDNPGRGGPSGGGGAGGGFVYISANSINRSTATTPASVISARGGNGGNGGNAVAGGTNVGGGGGAGGAGGGWVYLVYGSITGSTGVNAIDVSGSTGGNGGNGAGTGLGGNGGGGGGGGRVVIINLSTNSSTSALGGLPVNGSAAVGNIGGAGAAGITFMVSL